MPCLSLQEMNGGITYQPVRGHLARVGPSHSSGRRRNGSESDRVSRTADCDRAFGRREARTYVFGDDDASDADEELHREDMELVWKGRISDSDKKHRSLVTFAEAPVRKGDTLVAIALRYGCKVGELKHLNRMMHDQDVFGLRTIRVPVKRYGMVEEIIRMEMAAEEAKLNIGGTIELSDDDSGTDNDFASDEDEAISETTLNGPLLPQSSVLSGLSAEGRKAVKYLHSVDNDIRTVVSAVAASRTFNATVGDYSVDISDLRPKPYDGVSLWGVDCGLRWSTIVIGAVVILIIVPAVVFAYNFVSHSHS